MQPFFCVAAPCSSHKHRVTTKNGCVGEYQRTALRASRVQTCLLFVFVKEAEERGKFAVNYMKEIAHTAILTERKKKKLDEILPELFCQMVQTAVVDLADLDKFMRNSFEKLKQK